MTLVPVNGVELCVETFGDAATPPILLISGAAASMDYWDTAFCRRLATGGRHVIRYDHRDTGESVSYPPGKPSYTGEDLTADAAALIGALAGGQAHVVGISMGGGIAQHLAIDYPALVASLTLLSTSPGPADDLPPPTQRARAAFADPLPDPDWTDVDAVVEYLVEGERPFAGPDSFDEAYARDLARRVVARTRNVESASKNHWILEGGAQLRSRLGQITAPTLVIHGTDDPAFPPGHGEVLVREIGGAELLLLDGVGHQMPPPSTWDVVIPAILRHTSR
jgi:pimeloyl-ACP methyl ester carboxylesterase